MSRRAVCVVSCIKMFLMLEHSFTVVSDRTYQLHTLSSLMDLGAQSILILINYMLKVKLLVHTSMHIPIPLNIPAILNY
jgi:hypothetical protein